MHCSCIYCAACEPNHFKGCEHVIPQSFGLFGTHTPTLDCVCDDCNAYFSRELEQVLDAIDAAIRVRDKLCCFPSASTRWR